MFLSTKFILDLHYNTLLSVIGGPMFRLKGSILSMSFLDCNGALIPYSYEPWKDDGSRRDREFLFVGVGPVSHTLYLPFSMTQGTPTKGNNRMSPTLSGSDSFSDRQFIAITSEKSARVIALPSQNCVYRQQIADTDYVVKAEIISFKGKSYCTTNQHNEITSIQLQIAFVLFVMSQPDIWLRTVCQVFGHWWTSIFCHWPISGIFNLRIVIWIKLLCNLENPSNRIPHYFFFQTLAKFRLGFEPLFFLSISKLNEWNWLSHTYYYYQTANEVDSKFCIWSSYLAWILNSPFPKELINFIRTYFETITINITLYPLNHSIHHNFTNRQLSSRFSHGIRPQTQHLTIMASVVNVSQCHTSHHMNVVNQWTNSQTCSCNITVLVSTSI